MAGLISTGQLGYCLQQRPLRLDGVALNSGVITVTLPIGNTYVPLAETLAALGPRWRWSGEEGILFIDSATLSPVQPASTEVISAVEHHLRTICGAEMDIRVDGRTIEIPWDGFKYVPAEAIVCENKLYVRCEAMSAALDLIYVQDDGFYRKTDSPLCWDYTFTPYMGGESEWLLSATPSFFHPGRGTIGIMSHDRTAPVTVTFSRKMDETTLNSDNIAVIYRTACEDGRVKYKTISDSYRYGYDKTSNTLTITPCSTVDLPSDTDVTIAIKPSIADAEGKHPSGGIKIGFRAVQ